MFIPVTEIDRWETLQDKVRDFFIELGYDAETSKVIELSNGGFAEVDVVATMGNSPLAQRILVECKLWNQNIPRSIVQSFKMDVQDSGSNFGIIVSKQGFQQGAYQGVSLTTVKLFTFEELQEAFSGMWASHNLFPLERKRQAVLDLSQSFNPGTYQKKHYDGLRQYPMLSVRHEALKASVQFALAIYSDFYNRDPFRFGASTRRSLPVNDRHGNQIVAEFSDARSFVACMNRLLDEALDSWDAYLDDYKRVVMDRVPVLPIAATPLMADTPVP